MKALNIALPLLLATAQAALAAPAEGANGNDRAAERCEAAVADTVRDIRGRSAQDVQFVGSKRAIAPTPDSKIGVKGEGIYRAAGGSGVPFTYSCAFDTETGATSGVVFRDAAPRQAAPAPVAEPDITLVSPEACEAATAGALKEKFPRVGRIAFDVGTRKLRPAPDAQTSLEGQVAVERAPGMALIPITYRCLFAPRTGRLVSASIDG
jgi:hypothetical protein